jgi:hypothetical protein
MAAWQVPRFSGLLRAVQEKSKQLFDIEREEVQRSSALKRRIRQRQDQDQGSGNTEWLAMFGALERSGAGNAARTKDARDKYGRMMLLISDLASDGIRVEEQHAIALYVWQQLTSRKIHNEHQKKETIEKMLGPIPKGPFRELKQLVDYLSTNWVQAVVGIKPDKGKKPGAPDEPDKPVVTHEFGEELYFVSPFVVQPTPEEGIAAGEEAGGAELQDWRSTAGLQEAVAAEADTEEITFQWLVQKSHASLVQSGMSEVSHDDAVDHAEKLQAMLGSPAGDDELQNDLFDLVGDFEFIAALLEHRYLPPAHSCALPMAQWVTL